MITLFEENERKFDSLGLGVLKDALSCPVKESLNDAFTLSMEYPINGYLYSKIKINRIIYCKSNPFDDSYQPFRIRSITKPIKGIVTVEAVHVSYDANGFPVKPISGLNLSDIFNKLVNGEEKEDKHIKYVLVDDMPFTFKTNIYMGRTFKTNAPYNLRALLMGGDECLLKKYDAEVQFNKFEINFLTKRGKDRGAKVIYGKNMTDLTNVSTNEMLYTGVYPYYHSESTSNDTVTSGEFKKAYIVGSKEFQDGWLSYSENGEPFHPVTDSPIQIATEGKYYEKVYCWNETTQRFDEKIYNQSVMLIQDVLEPEWVTIDWSHFPTVICKARKKGYYKKSTDDSWGSIKGVGDTVFEASILNSGIMENIMLSFAEVIPPTKDTENTEVEEIVHVELDDPIIPINTIETKQMKHENILSLDLTSEFEEEPTQQQLKNKAEEYISKNKIGVSKDNITVSFVDLSQTTEGKKYEKFDHIEIGDTVHVIYEELGVNTALRVISIEYDPILNRYNSIELGEKQDDMSSQIVQSGDNVSSLTNDVGYANVTTVNKLIANTVTAEWLEAVNAKLSKAAISQLEVERINCKGIFEASQFTLDTLVSKMLIAENAQIAKTLEAGQIKVSGNINVKGGSISINGTSAENQNETYFIVDRNGNVIANSVSITGGELDIGNGNFVVTNEGIMSAKMAYIEGSINATSGNIGGFTISENSLYARSGIDGYVYIGPDKIQCGPEDNPNFIVDNDGLVKAKNIEIEGGSIDLIYPATATHKQKSFKVSAENGMEMNSGNISLGAVDKTTGNYKLHFKYSSDSNIYYSYLEYLGTAILNDETVGKWKHIVNDNEYIVYTDTYVSNNNLIIEPRDSHVIQTDSGEDIAKFILIYFEIINEEVESYNKFIVNDEGQMNMRDGSIKLGHIDEVTGEYILYTDIGQYIYVTQQYINHGNYGLWKSLNNFLNTWNIVSDYQYGSLVTKNLIQIDDHSEEIILDINSWNEFTEMTIICFDNNKQPVGTIPVRIEEFVDGRYSFSGQDLIQPTWYIALAFDNQGEIYEEVPEEIQNAKLWWSSSQPDYLQNDNVIYTNALVNLNTNELNLAINNVILYNDETLHAISNKAYEFHTNVEHVNAQKDVFAVDEYGNMTAKSGHIANFVISENELYSGTLGNPNSVYISPTGSYKKASIGGSAMINGWVYTSGETFGVTYDGHMYANAGKIAGMEIDDNSMTYYLNDEIIISISNQSHWDPRYDPFIIGDTPETYCYIKRATFDGILNMPVTYSGYNIYGLGTDIEHELSSQVHGYIRFIEGTMQSVITSIPDEPGPYGALPFGRFTIFNPYDVASLGCVYLTDMHYNGHDGQGYIKKDISAMNTLPVYMHIYQNVIVPHQSWTELNPSKDRDFRDSFHDNWKVRGALITPCSLMDQSYSNVISRSPGDIGTYNCSVWYGKNNNNENIVLIGNKTSTDLNMNVIVILSEE